MKAFAVFISLGLALATPLTNFRVLEKRDLVPHGFSRVGPASPEQTISLRLALAQNNEAGMIDALYSVSDPKSATYGQHLSKAQVRMFDRPLCARC